jgi:hypothetical protein
MRPARLCAQKRHDQDHDQYSSKHCFSFSRRASFRLRDHD